MYKRMSVLTLHELTDSKDILTLRKDIESSFEGEGLYTGLG